MLKGELQQYLDKTHPGASIDTPHSIGGNVQIRFELGGGLKNGTEKLVLQATERAWSIFNETYNANNLWILIYDYNGADPNCIQTEYLYQLFEPADLSNFHNQMQLINSRFFTKDVHKNEVLEKWPARVMIGWVNAKQVQIKNIFRGIANNEMGFDPKIQQEVYFIDPSTDRIFYMYDDRGCYVMSNDADKISGLYKKYNHWIVDYRRPEIDAYFN